MSNLEAELATQIQSFNIPVVDVHTPVSDPHAFMAFVRELKNFEGFIIAWSDGHRVKIKADEYVRIHKTKDNLIWEKNLIELMINEKLDDTKPYMLDEDLKRVEAFETDFWIGINQAVKRYEEYYQEAVRQNMDRKQFAQQWLPTLQVADPFAAPFVFARFDNKDARQFVINHIKKNCGTQTKVDSVRHLWGNAKWNYSFESDS